MDPTQVIVKTENSYELLKIILEFIGAISWPLVVIIIVIVFREQIIKIVAHAKKVELPGGVSFEVDQNISEAKQLASEIKDERDEKTQNLIDAEGPKLESEANKRMVKLGLNPSPSGLDLNYYRKIAITDPRLALMGVRMDFEIMLRNLAIGFKIPIEDKTPVFKIINLLHTNTAITTRQFEFINKVFRLANLAAHGAEISEKQANEVLDIAQILVEDYAAWLSWGFPE